MLISDCKSVKTETEVIKNYPPIQEVTRPTVPTSQAAYYLYREEQTLRTWACYETGPIRPIRVNRRLAWPVDQIRKALGVPNA
jgi:hypothetical protein